MYPQYSPAPSPNKMPWGLILGIGGGVMLLLVLLGFVGMGVYRMAVNLMPRELARSSKLPAEFMETQWKQSNPGEVKWETDSYLGDYTLERPTAKALSFPRNGFDTLTLGSSRALGPEGPYFAAMSSSAGLLSRIQGTGRESTPEILELAIKVRQILPKGNLIRSSDFQVAGHPGKEMTFTETIDGKPIVIHVRMIVDRDHLYALWAGGLESTLKDEDVRRFLDSLRPKEKGASSPF